MSLSASRSYQYAAAAISLTLLVSSICMAADAARLSPPPAKPTAPTVEVIDLPTFYKLWTASQAAGANSNITILDVRLSAAFQLSHVPAARNVPYTNAKKVATSKKKRAVDDTKNIACYGTEQKTAVSACKEFAKVKAYWNVRIYALSSGFTNWVLAKYPVETSI